MSSVKMDRAQQNVGNIVYFEHVNVTIPRQDLATAFYVVGLGLTRDPYLMVGLENMWMNAGRQQFHLPTRPPQLLRGRVGLVVPDLDALCMRLDKVTQSLEGTQFSFTRGSDGDAKHVDVICPWGNRIRCYPPSGSFGNMQLGIAYVGFDVRPGTAAGIARFYERVMAAPGGLLVHDGGEGQDEARIPAGPSQTLRFIETAAGTDERPYDGHHIAIYIAAFDSTYRRLDELGLITAHNGDFQYRFQSIVDPDSGDALFEIEHEVRSLSHPLYGRPFINRNPAQQQATYQPGRDAFRG